VLFPSSSTKQNSEGKATAHSPRWFLKASCLARALQNNLRRTLGAALFAVMLIAHGELLAAMCAARRQNAAAILRGHSLTEAVFVHAAAVVGLECSFHRSMLFVLFFSDGMANHARTLGCKVTNFFTFGKFFRPIFAKSRHNSA